MLNGWRKWKTSSWKRRKLECTERLHKQGPFVQLLGCVFQNRSASGHSGETCQLENVAAAMSWRGELHSLPLLPSMQLPKECKTSLLGEGQAHQTWPVNPVFKKMLQLNWPHLRTYHQRHHCSASVVTGAAIPKFPSNLCNCEPSTFVFKWG